MRERIHVGKLTHTHAHTPKPNSPTWRRKLLMAENGHIHTLLQLKLQLMESSSWSFPTTSQFSKFDDLEILDLKFLKGIFLNQGYENLWLIQNQWKRFLDDTTESNPCCSHTAQPQHQWCKCALTAPTWLNLLEEWPTLLAALQSVLGNSAEDQEETDRANHRRHFNRNMECGPWNGPHPANRPLKKKFFFRLQGTSPLPSSSLTKERSLTKQKQILCPDEGSWIIIFLESQVTFSQYAHTEVSEQAHSHY